MSGTSEENTESCEHTSPQELMGKKRVHIEDDDHELTDQSSKRRKKDCPSLIPEEDEPCHSVKYTDIFTDEELLTKIAVVKEYQWLKNEIDYPTADEICHALYQNYIITLDYLEEAVFKYNKRRRVVDHMLKAILRKPIKAIECLLLKSNPGRLMIQKRLKDAEKTVSKEDRRQFDILEEEATGGEPRPVRDDLGKSQLLSERHYKILANDLGYTDSGSDKANDYLLSKFMFSVLQHNEVVRSPFPATKLCETVKYRPGLTTDEAYTMLKAIDEDETGCLLKNFIRKETEGGNVQLQFTKKDVYTALKINTERNRSLFSQNQQTLAAGLKYEGSHHNSIALQYRLDRDDSLQCMINLCTNGEISGLVKKVFTSQEVLEMLGEGDFGVEVSVRLHEREKRLILALQILDGDLSESSDESGKNTLHSLQGLLAEEMSAEELSEVLDKRHSPFSDMRPRDEKVRIMLRGLDDETSASLLCKLQIYLKEKNRLYLLDEIQKREAMLRSFVVHRSYVCLNITRCSYADTVNNEKLQLECKSMQASRLVERDSDNADQNPRQILLVGLTSGNWVSIIRTILQEPLFEQDSNEGESIKILTPTSNIRLQESNVRYADDLSNFLKDLSHEIHAVILLLEKGNLTPDDEEILSTLQSHFGENIRLLVALIEQESKEVKIAAAEGQSNAHLSPLVRELERRHCTLSLPREPMKDAATKLQQRQVIKGHLKVVFGMNRADRRTTAIQTQDFKSNKTEDVRKHIENIKQITGILKGNHGDTDVPSKAESIEDEADSILNILNTFAKEELRT